MKLGIDNLKVCVKFGIDLGEAVDASLPGGLTVADVPNFFKPLMEISSAITAAKQVPAELKDLDTEEAAELSAYVTTELHIADAKVEEVIKKSFAVVVSVLEIVEVMKAAKVVAPVVTPAV